VSSISVNAFINVMLIYVEVCSTWPWFPNARGTTDCPYVHTTSNPVYKVSLYIPCPKPGEYFVGHIPTPIPVYCSHTVVRCIIYPHPWTCLGISKGVHTKLVSDQYFLSFVNGDHQLLVAVRVAMSNYNESTTWFITHNASRHPHPSARVISVYCSSRYIHRSQRLP